MDNNAYLVWWLLAVPIVLAVVDWLMMGRSNGTAVGAADSYIARQRGRRATPTTPAGDVPRPL